MVEFFTEGRPDRFVNVLSATALGASSELTVFGEETDTFLVLDGLWLAWLAVKAVLVAPEPGQGFRNRGPPAPIPCLLDREALIVEPSLIQELA